MADKEVIVRLTLDDKDFENQVDQIPKEFDKAGKKSGVEFSSGLRASLKGLSGPINAVKASLGGLAVAFAGAFAFKEAIQTSQEFQNSLIGLTTVANAFGADIKAVEQAAKDLASEGLIPLGDVSASLKNLITATNGDIDQAVKAFKALRDAASFNRQGQLSLADAIRGATDGIKNQNSVLVDNAGITKNLSILVKEYAAEIGKSVAELTEYEKKQAIINGIIKEGAIFTGDFAKAQETFTGATGQLSSTFSAFLAELGNFVTTSPAIIDAINGIASAIGAVTSFIRPETVEDLNVKIGETTQRIQQLKNEIRETQEDQSFIGSLLGEFNLNDLTKQLALQEELLLTQQKQRNELLAEQQVQSDNSAIEQEKKKQVEINKVAKKGGEEYKKINQAVSNAASNAIVGGIQTIVKSLAEGQNAGDAFSRFLISAFGDLATQAGSALIGIGVGQLSILQGNPAGAIAAGAGLVALGQIIKSFVGDPAGFSSTPAPGTNITSTPSVLETDVAQTQLSDDLEPLSTVTINVQGDYFDSEESATRIVQLINENADSANVVINRGAIA